MVTIVFPLHNYSIKNYKNFNFVIDRISDCGIKVIITCFENQSFNLNNKSVELLYVDKDCDILDAICKKVETKYVWFHNINLWAKFDKILTKIEDENVYNPLSDIICLNSVEENDNFIDNRKFVTSKDNRLIKSIESLIIKKEYLSNFKGIATISSIILNIGSEKIVSMNNKALRLYGDRNFKLSNVKLNFEYTKSVEDYFSVDESNTINIQEENVSQLDMQELIYVCNKPVIDNRICIVFVFNEEAKNKIEYKDKIDEAIKLINENLSIIVIEFVDEGESVFRDYEKRNVKQYEVHKNHLDGIKDTYKILKTYTQHKKFLLIGNNTKWDVKELITVLDNIIIGSNNTKNYVIKSHDNFLAVDDNNTEEYALKSEKYIYLNNPEIGLAMTAHKPYIENKYIYNSIDSINSQVYQPTKKVIVLDNVDYIPRELLYKMSGWIIVNMQNGSPNPGRNKGLEVCNTPWIIFWDADNKMEKDYIKKMHDCSITAKRSEAIFYTDVIDISEDGHINYEVRQENPTFQNLQKANFVDTAALWRSEAVRTCGGWKDYKCFDDYSLAYRVCQNGWKMNRVKDNVLYHFSHIGQRNVLMRGNNYEGYHNMFAGTRRHNVISIFAGREELLDDWFGSFERQIFPNNILFNFYVDCKDDKFIKKLESFIHKSKHRWLITLRHTSSLNIEKNMVYEKVGRDAYVANLYSNIFRRLSPAEITFTWEDDNIPVEANSFMELIRYVNPKTQIGGITAKYPGRQNSGCMCCARSMDSWSNTPLMSEKSNQPETLGFIGGGFTAWLTAALADCAPSHTSLKNNGILGWDANLSLDIREYSNMKVAVHHGILCEHRTKLEKFDEKKR